MYYYCHCTYLSLLTWRLGLYTKVGNDYSSRFTDNPAIPPGAGDTTGCTPFIYGYTFDTLQKKASDTQHYYIPIPSSTGGTSGKNYAYSIQGIQDRDHDCLPVSLRISSAGASNPVDPIIGFNYESPMIGTSTIGNSYTNTGPDAFLVTLEATVSGLVAGNTYNLYIYSTSVTPLPSRGLNVPTSNFNAQANLASKTIAFEASSDTFVVSETVLSTDTVVFRCVLSSAP